MGKMTYVSKKHPCFICGSMDQCSYGYNEKGSEIAFCYKGSGSHTHVMHCDVKETLVGADGRAWYKLKQASNGCHIYMLYDDHVKEDEAWKAERREEWLAERKKEGFKTPDVYNGVCPICGKPNKENGGRCFNSPKKAYCYTINPKKVADGVFIDSESRKWLMQGEKYYATEFLLDGEPPKAAPQPASAAAPEKLDLSQMKHAVDPSRVWNAEESLPEDWVPVMEREKLDKILRFVWSQLVLEDRDCDYLVNNQKWTYEEIIKFEAKSSPGSDATRSTFGNQAGFRNMKLQDIAKLCEEHFGPGCLKGVPGAYEGKFGWTFNIPSGILVPVKDYDGYWIAFRIRMNWMDTKENLEIHGNDVSFVKDGERYKLSYKGVSKEITDEDGTGTGVYESQKIDTMNRAGKYRFMTSRVDDEQGRNILKNGTKCPNIAGYIAYDDDDKGIMCIGEGEFKMHVTENRLKWTCLSLPGVSSHKLSLPYIERALADGLEMVVIAFDADKNENGQVYDALLGFVNNELWPYKEQGRLQIFLADWPESFGKGIDDCLVNGHFPKLYKLSSPLKAREWK